MPLCGIDQKPIDLTDNCLDDIRHLIGKDSAFNIRSYFCNTIYEDNSYSCNDTFIADTNTIIQRIGIKVLDGTEDWAYDEITKTYYYHQENKFCNPCSGYFDTILCTHFLWRQHLKNPPYSTVQGGVENEIMFNYDDGNGGVDNFIQWLQAQIAVNTPVKVLFVLQHPIIYYIEVPNPDPRFIPKHYFIKSEEDIQPPIEIHKSDFYRPF